MLAAQFLYLVEGTATIVNSIFQVIS